MNINRLLSALAALSMLAIACKPDNPTPKPDPEPDPVIPTPDPTPDPDPDPAPETLEAGFIYLLSADGAVERKVEVGSATSFTRTGFLAFYFSNLPGLSKDVASEPFDFEEGRDYVFGVNMMSGLNGKTVDIMSEKLRFMVAVYMGDIVTFDAANDNRTSAVKSGEYQLDVDVDGRKASLDLSLGLNDGRSIKAKVESEYIPGGENSTYFYLGEDFSRPVRAAFYDYAEGYEEVMYFATGEIDYGEEVSKTIYAAVAPVPAICDGEYHSIAECIADGSLVIMVRDFNSLWDVVSGSIAVRKNGLHDYEVTISGARVADQNMEYEDMNFEMYWNGPLKDMSIERPVDNVFTVGKASHSIGSVVYDLRGDIAHIYFTEAEGITTVEAAAAADPVHVTVTASKFSIPVGLSTDTEVFSVSYGGNTWDAGNLDTGSYIVHKYDKESGLIHVQLANLYPKNSGSTVLKLEYKGYPTYIR